MKSKSYLIFTLENSHYAIEATLVREIFPLPELTLIPESPDDVVGLLNWHSKIVPVIHLAKRLGYPLPEFSLSESVIVMEWKDLQIAMIVNTVREVMTIEPTAIATDISYSSIPGKNARLISDVAQVGAEIIMLLNPERLIRNSEAVATLMVEQNNSNLPSSSINDLSLEAIDAALMAEATDELLAELSDNRPRQNINSKVGILPTPQELLEKSNEAPEVSNPEIDITSERAIAEVTRSFYDLYCPNATAAEREILRQRAENLRQSIRIGEDTTEQIPLAIISLNGKYFGLDVNLVREFIEIRNITPIPCCPARVLGNINLRGEILTLIDIRQALNMPFSTPDKAPTAMVVQVGDIIAGIPVEQVCDVMYFRALDVQPLPLAVQSGSEIYLQGTAPYSQTMLSILDLAKILTRVDLTVDEEV
jgi:purine-binding chemotaxis protein CheW